MTRQEAIYKLAMYPYVLGHLIGFTKLTTLHNEWIKQMTSGEEDETLQAHRGSYKTTCVSLALSIIMVTKPKKKIMFMRKTDTDTKEIIAHFQEMEAHQFDGITDDDRMLCHGLFGDEDAMGPEMRPLFEQHYPGMAHIFPGGHRMNAQVVKQTLLPYIKSLGIF